MWNWIQARLSDAAEVARLVIFGCCAIIALMWLINIAGWQSVNGVFGFIGLIMVVFLAISPRLIQPTAAFTGLLALLNQQNPLRGALVGPLWVVSVARSFLYGFLFFAIFLTLKSFENSPFAFWGIFLLAMMLFIWRERYGRSGPYAKWLEWGFIVGCGVVLMWTTLSGPYQGKAFDPQTGGALYMVDPATGKIDSLNRTPKECASKPKGCYSGASGRKLVPMDENQALARNVTAWPGVGIESVRNAEIPSIGVPLSVRNAEIPSWVIPLIVVLGVVLLIMLLIPALSRGIGGSVQTLIIIALLALMGWWAYPYLATGFSGSRVLAAESKVTGVSSSDCKLLGIAGLPEIVVPNKDAAVKAVEYAMTANQPFVLNLSRLSISPNPVDHEYMYDLNQTQPVAVNQETGKSRPAIGFLTGQGCWDNGVAKAKMTPVASQFSADNPTIKMAFYDADLK